MPTGQGATTKVFLSKADEDFVVFAESAEDVKAWRKDKSIALAQVVNGFKIFVTHKQGAQGILDTASKAALENAFGTKDEDEVIKKILEEGQIQGSDNPARESSTNDSIGSLGSHR